MTDSEAATRAIVNFFATGDLDVSSSVADEYVHHQGLGASRFEAQTLPTRPRVAISMKGDMAGVAVPLAPS
jgi:hypothetical protein